MDLLTAPAQRITRIVTSKFGDAPALRQLLQEARTRGDVTAPSRAAMRALLITAAVADADFAGMLSGELGADASVASVPIPGGSRGDSAIALSPFATSSALSELMSLSPRQWLGRLRRKAAAQRNGSGDVGPGGAYTAYPRLDVVPFVVADDPFDTRIGIAPTYDDGVATTGSLRIDLSDSALELDVELLFDPRSFTTDDATTITLFPSHRDPFPSVLVRLVPHSDPELSPQRTLRLLFRRAGRIIGIASRTVTVVGSPLEVIGLPHPQHPRHRMLDLAPLLGELPPDLVIVIFRADEPDTFVWDAYPLTGRIPIPDGRRRSRIGHDARTLAANTRTVVQSGGLPAYDHIVGTGALIRAAIPTAIQEVVRNLLTGRQFAPTVLLLTEEVFVPWELAVFDPPLDTRFGGDARFLGAHVAISRWPLGAEDSRPGFDRREHVVVRQGVVTADYAGVHSWPELTETVREAQRFRELHGPAEEIAATRDSVIDCLEGRIPVDLLHIALHGAYDASLSEDGLVFPVPGSSEPAFLSALAVLGMRNRSATPFIYLNACEVGAGDEILGSSVGFAPAVLHTGAIGVVAPIWRVDDHAAADVAARFYDAVYHRHPVPVAEAIRRIRARYTRAAVAADPKSLSPTHVAYLAFCHPGLMLLHLPTSERH
ncbi:CHAT domain-containing protein [Nocardia aurantia]|nr:CHAT domain-containing protein [Nocardia aurantia]